MAAYRSPAAPDHPVTVVLPGTPGDPTIVDYRPAGLRLAVVTRSNINRLDDRWDSPGNYILLDPPRPDGTYGAYVGKAPMGLKSRLRSHVTGKQHWHRALLVVRDSYNGFHSAEVSWLEGRFYDHLYAAPAVTLSNRQRPRDETLPQYERDVLEFAVDPVTRLLAFIGHDITSRRHEEPNADGCSTVVEACGSVESRPSVASRAARAPSVMELVERGVLHIGQILYPPAGGRVTAPAVVASDGKVQWGGTPYGSLSAAAVAALGGQSRVNGYVYWGIDLDGERVPLAQHLRGSSGSPSTAGGVLKRKRSTGPRSSVGSDDLVDGSDEGAVAPTRSPRPSERDMDRPQQEVEAPGPRRSAPRRFNVTLTMLLASGHLQAGQTLYPSGRKVTLPASVTADGQVEWDGRTYSSLSTAAEAAWGLRTAPGWNMWLVATSDGSEPIKEVRARYLLEQAAGMSG